MRFASSAHPSRSPCLPSWPCTDMRRQPRTPRAETRQPSRRRPQDQRGAPGQLALVVTGERFTPGEQVRVVLCPPTPTGPGDPGPAVPAPCAPEVGTLLSEVTADSIGSFAFQTDVAREGEDQRAIVEVLRAGEATPIASAVAPVDLPGSARPSWGDDAGLIAAYFGLPLLIAALIAWGIIRGMRRPRLAGQAARGNGDAQPAG